MKAKEISTERLLLVPFTLAMTDALIKGNIKEVHELGFKTNGKWPRQDTKDILPFIMNDLKRNGGSTGFECWMIVLASNMLVIGDIGFKGLPDKNGAVEIGYGLIEDERRNGYGFEAAKAMVNWAFSFDEVKSVNADCLINNVPSIKILEKLHMEEVRRDKESIYWKLSR